MKVKLTKHQHITESIVVEAESVYEAEDKSSRHEYSALWANPEKDQNNVWVEGDEADPEFKGKPENPLLTVLANAGVEYDAEVAAACDKRGISFGEPEAVADYCLQVMPWTDFTTALLHDPDFTNRPGFCYLGYCGSGITGLYVFYGTKERVLERIQKGTNGNSR